MSENTATEKFVSQALAMANNYFCTGRPNKALEMLTVVQRLASENEILKIMMQKTYCISMDHPAPNLDSEFGAMWRGEDLSDKSIEVFCDQGIGDTINLLRYLRVLKEKYKCKIVLNCYAFFNQFERLIATQEYIDEFTPFHKVCDYSTNIMSIPSLLNALDLEIYYPVHFQENMCFPIPDQPCLAKFDEIVLEGNYKFGMVWQSNSNNPLSVDKSIPVDLFYSFALPVSTSYCLQPSVQVPPWMVELPINDLYDTAAFIQACDCVVSVDTAVLHLAGALGKKTFGLLPYNCDPRWGTEKSTCWYPSVELFRQKENKDWSEAITEIESRLVSLCEIV